MNYNKIIIILLSVAGLFLLSCNTSGNMKEGENGVFVLEVNKFQEKLSSEKNSQLIDVRTPEEYESGHLAGAKNININDSNFEDEVKKLDKSKPVFLYCRSGGRSASASEILHKLGFSKVFDMQGGITAWNAEDLPLDAQVGVSGISEADYAKIIQKDKLVLVDFNAKWCTPCKELSPILDKVSKEFPDKMELVKIDIDKNPEIAKALSINAIPALKLYKNGKVVWEYLGLLTEQEVRETLSKNF